MTFEICRTSLYEECPLLDKRVYGKVVDNPIVNN